MQVLGLSSIAKSAKICDEHFEDDCFYDNLMYTKRRCLRPNAIPKSYSSKGENISLHIPNFKNSSAQKILSDITDKRYGKKHNKFLKCSGKL